MYITSSPQFIRVKEYYKHIVKKSQVYIRRSAVRLVFQRALKLVRVRDAAKREMHNKSARDMPARALFTVIYIYVVVYTTHARFNAADEKKKKINFLVAPLVANRANGDFRLRIKHTHTQKS